MFLKLWEVQNNEIVEKVNLKSKIDKNGHYVEGTYFSISGNPANCQILREFKKIEDVVEYINVCFDEFTEKYPNCKGFIQLHPKESTRCIGEKLDREWGTKYAEK